MLILCLASEIFCCLFSEYADCSFYKNVQNSCSGARSNLILAFQKEAIKHPYSCPWNLCFRQWIPTLTYFSTPSLKWEVSYQNSLQGTTNQFITKKSSSSQTRERQPELAKVAVRLSAALTVLTIWMHCEPSSWGEWLKINVSRPGKISVGRKDQFLDEKNRKTWFQSGQSTVRLSASCARTMYPTDPWAIWTENREVFPQTNFPRWKETESLLFLQFLEWKSMVFCGSRESGASEGRKPTESDLWCGVFYGMLTPGKVWRLTKTTTRWPIWWFLRPYVHNKATAWTGA